MSVQAVLLPVFVQVALTVVLAGLMGSRRFAAVRAGQVQVADISMGQRAWPAPAQKAANAFQNQFELPVLFYALVVLAVITRKADLLFVAMSWVYVLTRLAHAYVYTTTNHVRRRFGVFVVGAVVLMLMWIIFAVRVLGAGL